MTPRRDTPAGAGTGTGTADRRPGAGGRAVDVDAVVAATAGCRTVAGLSGGPLGTVATYLPGRRVVGVRVGDDTLSVHVTGVYGPSVAEIGGEVRDAVAPLAGGRTVEVVLEDLTGGTATEVGPAGRRSGRPARTEPR